MRPAGKGPLDSLYFDYPIFKARRVPELDGATTRHPVLIVGAGPIGMTAENIDAPTALAWGLVDKVAPAGGLDEAVEHTVKALLECGPEALRSQKALLRQWEELPLKESVDLSVGVFGKSFLSGEPQKMMQDFLDRKR